MLIIKKILIVILLISITIFLSCRKQDKKSNNINIAKCTHAYGLCNLPMFISFEAQTAKEFGTEFELYSIPNWADHPAALSSGTVDFSVTPFTNVIAAYANGAPIKIISGSGIGGLYILSNRKITTILQLKGKKIGTFRADTLEMLLYSFLIQNDLSYEDVEIVYFTDAFEIVQAFGSGRIDAMTHVEPFATSAEREFNAVKLISGTDIWGEGYPDCVLTASDKIIKENPDLVKTVIVGMMKAELLIEENFDKAVDMVIGKYYKFC